MIRFRRTAVFVVVAACVVILALSRIASTHWVEVTVSRRALADVVPVLWFNFAVDVAVLAIGCFIALWLILREFRARLEKARLKHLEEVALLSGGFAHEARNYIHAMQTRLGLLRKSLSGNTKAEDRAAKLEEITAGLEQLLSDFLTFARPAADELEEADPVNLVRQVIDFEQFELERANVDVHLDAPETLPRILVDQGKLKRALLNLLVNARQAMPEGGHIYVRLRRQRRGVCIEIEDTGSGIPPEEQERVFQTYFTTKPDGTGLGLAVVKRTVEDFGGHIAFTSTPGHGTTFRITLPTLQQRRARLREAAARPVGNWAGDPS